MFLNSLRKKEVEAQVEFTLKLWKGLGSPVIDVTGKKHSLSVYVLYVFGILAGRCCSEWYCKGERLGYERSGFEVQVRPWVAIFLSCWIETLSITGQKI